MHFRLLDFIVFHSHECFKRIKIIGAVINLSIKSLRRQSAFDGGCGNLLLFFNVELAHQESGVADVFVRLLLFCNENFHNADIAFDAIVFTLNHQIANIRLFCLAVSVNTPVPLLEYHKRPRNIEMNEPVAQIM